MQAPSWAHFVPTQFSTSTFFFYTLSIFVSQKTFFSFSIFCTIQFIFVLILHEIERRQNNCLKANFFSFLFMNKINPLSYLHFFYFKHFFVVLLICLNLFLTLHLFCLQVSLDCWKEIDVCFLGAIIVSIFHSKQKKKVEPKNIYIYMKKNLDLW